MHRGETDVAERARLDALYAYEVLDTAPEDEIDDVISLAARLTGSPIALVSLIDAERQWFKARLGFAPAETDRSVAFCAHAILDPHRPLIVPDATVDPRFAANPLVTCPAGIRAYLGVPLVTPEGHAIGTLCVLDQVPRPSYVEDAKTLKTLARAVSTHLDLRRSNLRFSRATQTDALTGMPNRRAMMSALSDLLERDHAAGVIMIDLDYFKEVNDCHGHATGDGLLQVIAARLQSATRHGDLAARIGGDEFVLLLAGVSDHAIAADVAARISAVLCTPITHGGTVHNIGATLGVAVAPSDADDADMILRAADEALMTAKRNRRGSIGMANRSDVDRVRRGAAIFRAFDLNRGKDHVVRGAIPYFQPIVQLSAGPAASASPVAFEALTRWSAPGLGQIPPDELFAVIGPERTALVSNHVRKLAMAQFAALRAQGLTTARIAINLSMGEVVQADIALLLEEQVVRAGLALSDIEIEITEELLLDRVSDVTLKQLSSLQDRGARVILDDFGIANSGLAQLMDMRLDGVKLDKHFVQGLGRDARAETIVNAAVSVAHSLGLHIVAEGVETESQRDTLLALHCDAAQGYLFSRPIPCSDLAFCLGLTRRAIA